MHPSAQRLPTMYASPPKVFSQYILVCNQCIIYSCVCPSKVLFQSYRDSLPKQKKHVKLNLHHGSSDLRRGTPFPVVARFSAGLPPKALTCKKGMWIIPTYLRSQSFLLSFHIFPISSHPHSSCVFHLLTSHYKDLLRCCVIYNIYTYIIYLYIQLVGYSANWIWAAFCHDLCARSAPHVVQLNVEDPGFLLNL